MEGEGREGEGREGGREGEGREGGGREGGRGEGGRGERERERERERESTPHLIVLIGFLKHPIHLPNKSGQQLSVLGPVTSGVLNVDVEAIRVCLGDPQQLHNYPAPPLDDITQFSDGVAPTQDHPHLPGEGWSDHASRQLSGWLKLLLLNSMLIITPRVHAHAQQG